MTRVSLMLLLVGLACGVVAVGCVVGDGSPTPTVAPTGPPSAHFAVGEGSPQPIPIVTEARLHGALPSPDSDPDSQPSECGDFESWRQANQFFIAAGGPKSDPFGMDPEGDGIPCETLREQELGR